VCVCVCVCVCVSPLRVVNVTDLIMRSLSLSLPCHVYPHRSLHRLASDTNKEWLGARAVRALLLILQRHPEQLILLEPAMAALNQITIR
jgi:hypothetical protein